MGDFVLGTGSFHLHGISICDITYFDSPLTSNCGASTCRELDTVLDAGLTAPNTFNKSHSHGAYVLMRRCEGHYRKIDTNDRC